MRQTVLLLLALPLRLYGQDAPSPPPGAGTLPSTFRLQPGAQVQVQTARLGTITGTPARPYTAASPYLDLCPAFQPRCAEIDSAAVRRVASAEIQKLNVWGRSTGPGLWIGLAVGGIGGGLYHAGLRDINETGLGIGLVLGAVVGGVLGSRIKAWQRVTPCFHACAAGTYP